MNNRALENLAAEAAERIDTQIGVIATRDYFNQCESPIERALLAAFEVHGILWSYHPIVGLPTPEQQEKAKQERNYPLFIKPQFEVAGYRADFLVGYVGAGKHTQTSIIVECDGHDWHEKTKEQAQRDKERDRVLHAHVAKVVRFTGSEVYRSPLGCAEDALGILETCLFAWVK